jgi:hypothetical protein
MSKPIGDMRERAHDGAKALLACVAAADLAAYRALAAAIDDFLLPENARLDERTRTALGWLVRALIETVEGEIGGHAVRLLRAQGEAALADALEAGRTTQSSDSSLLRDPELLRELIARVRQDLLAGGIAVQAHDDPERPSLLNRLAQQPDRLLAQAAAAVLVAESRRRSVPESGPLAQTDLPAELHHKLVWRTAAALRAGVAGPAAALDRALAEAAQRSLAAHDEGDRLEAAAMRLAVAIDARPDELPELMIEALGDRRVALFAALLAHALRIDFPAAREMMFDAASGRLWVALRALDFDRAAVAQLGVALSEADPRRSVENFAETLDAVMAIEPEEAREAIAPLLLPADYRAAILAREDGAR